ncbi:MAG: GAF domain-containing protein [Deltaproteobacteria bacterium]|nr:GAF domain-containing protein [Deltaproteobacteria bacterium]
MGEKAIDNESPFLERQPHVIKAYAIQLGRAAQRIRAEQTLTKTLGQSQRSQEEISGLMSRAKAVLVQNDFKEATQTLFDSCKNLLGAKIGYVALLNKKGTENGVFFLDSEGLPYPVDCNLAMPIRVLCDTVFHTRRAVFQNDFSNGGRMRLMPEGPLPLFNVLFAPMIVNGEGIGLLGFANKPGGFTEDDAHMASGFGKIMAIILTNKRMEEERESLLEYLEQRGHERTVELQRANEQLKKEIERSRQTEKILQLERNKLKGILESLNDGVYITNQNRDIQYINPVIEKEHGPVNGRKCHAYFHDLPTPCTWCKIQEVFAGKSVQWEWDSPQTGKTYDAFSTPILNERGDVMKMEILHDITEHKSVEESLRNALSEIKTLKDQLETENLYFRQEVKLKYQFGHIIGQSNAFKYVLHRAEQVAPTNTTVLILGETGTGKELIASAIHQMSPRKDRPLVTVNCAALPANLIESELFGREKGAFTGADTRQVGRFEVANGSTLCLDEIGELPLEVQAKLLRVIQHNAFERLGSSHTVRVDVRIIATTNRNLEEEVRKGRFRQDLYYRLNTFPITVPPLRQRKEDIPLLVQTFIERLSKGLGKQITSIQKETMKALQDYSWPGNIRELENVIERAVILSSGPLLKLSDKLENTSPLLPSTLRTLAETERDQILKTLSETRWRINGLKGAAEILDLHPSTLRARMQKLRICRPEVKLPE